MILKWTCVLEIFSNTITRNHCPCHPIPPQFILIFRTVGTYIQHVDYIFVLERTYYPVIEISTTWLCFLYTDRFVIDFLY